ncbi:GumC family protein [Bryocella elongata]|nr:polysaccharide biosynthesis tyrosine autokinase [Bryocella elongata]
MHLSDALVILRKKLWLIVGCVVVGVGLAVLLTSLMQRRFSSTVTIEVHKEGGTSLSLEDLSGAGQQLIGGDQLSVDLLTQQAVIGNENIAMKVLEDLGLTNSQPFLALRPANATASGQSLLETDPTYRDSAVNLFQSRLKITLVKGTRLVNVTYTDADPKQAARVANAVVEAYLISSTQQRYDATSKTSAWLTNQLSDLKNKVAESQRRVDDFRQKVGIIGAPTMSSAGSPQVGSDLGSVELARLNDLNAQLTAAETVRIAAEAAYRMTQSRDADVVLGIDSSQLNGAPGALASLDTVRLHQLRTQTGQLEVQISAETQKYGPRNPAILSLKSELAELQRQTNEEISRVGNQAARNLDLARKTEDGLLQSVDREKLRLGHMTTSADQLLLLEQEETSNRTLYQDLYGKLEAANILAGAKSSNVTIVNPARVPSGPSRPQPVQNIALGFLAGLATGLFLAFATAYHNDVLSTPEEVASLTSLPLLGLVPQAGKRRRWAYAYPYAPTKKADAAAESEGKFAWVLKAPRSVVAEACRQIRTAILLSRAEQPRTLLFTSSFSGEGKSTLTSNMAFAFGLQGSRVLLMDADMRRPTLHTKLGLTNGSGLSQCLTSDIDPASVIQVHPDMDKVHVMTSGPVPPAPSELLGSPRFVKLLEQMKKEYDYVFIDSPPVLLVTDAVLTSTLVDGVILVVRSGVTRRTPLRRALEQLAPSRNRLLGLILNAADIESSEFGGGYKYYGDSTYYEDSDA